MTERTPKVKLEVAKKQGVWVAIARFSGPTEFEVASQGTTLPDGLRSLAEAVELYFEHHAEHGEAS